MDRNDNEQQVRWHAVHEEELVVIEVKYHRTPPSTCLPEEAYRAARRCIAFSSTCHWVSCKHPQPQLKSSRRKGTLPAMCWATRASYMFASMCELPNRIRLWNRWKSMWIFSPSMAQVAPANDARCVGCKSARPCATVCGYGAFQPPSREQGSSSYNPFLMNPSGENREKLMNYIRSKFTDTVFHNAYATDHISTQQW